MEKNILLASPVLTGLLLLISFAIIPGASFSQNVGIGTTTPNAKAALDIKATDKGVLFPRLTTAQRNAITSPPDGLHIFNTDERCLNVFDSLKQLWNCYCFDCQTIVINITGNACKVDFYNSYAKNSPAKKYIINIAAGVTISGCNAGDTALSFSSMPFNAVITINNNGTIAGSGGKGGNGVISLPIATITCINQVALATPGQTGGAAISAKTGVLVTVNNYGTIAGGGGGGGGGGLSGTFTSSSGGGGGGGGAGTAVGTGGNAGGLLGAIIGLRHKCSRCSPNLFVLLVGSCELCSMNDIEIILKALQRERDDLHTQLMQVDRIIKRVKCGTYSQDDSPPPAPKQLTAELTKAPVRTLSPALDIKVQVLRALEVLGVASTLKQIQTEYEAMTKNKMNVRETVRSLQKSTLLKLLKDTTTTRGFMWIKTEWIQDGQLADKYKPEGFDLLYKPDNLIYE